MTIEYFQHHLDVCIAVSLCILVLICGLVLHICLCLHPKERKFHHLHRTNASGSETNQSSLTTTRLHQVNPLDHPHHHVLIDKGSPFFNWDDHPNLVAEAAENGWSRFAFEAQLSDPNSRGSDGTINPGNVVNRVVFGWEVCEGSEQKIQKVHANLGFRNTVDKSLYPPYVVIRAGLPLPGPCLGGSSFPQEAYFEITVLSCDNNENIHDNSSDNEVITSQLCVGLTGSSDPLPWRVPGSYEGSVGFNSNGSVYLNGTKLTSQSETKAWGKANKTIGCGYKPSQKRVFFTVDASLAHEVQCDNEAFGFPQYPTLVLNAEVTVSINLGQNPFEFLPGNVQRNPNPVFESASGYDYSDELFSIGSINGLQRSGTFKSNKATEHDHESESECFEISLDDP